MVFVFESKRLFEKSTHKEVKGMEGENDEIEVGSAKRDITTLRLPAIPNRLFLISS